MSGIVVSDASLAVKWVFQERHTLEARALLIEWEREDVARFAPLLFLHEINSALLRRLRDGIITAQQADAAREHILAAVNVSTEDAALTRRALAIADSLALRNAYDCAYLALAEREDCEYWTGDERFWNVAKAKFPRLHWVGEVSSP